MENFLFEILMEISILKHGNTACKKLKTMTVSLSDSIDKISKEISIVKLFISTNLSIQNHIKNRKRFIS